MQQIKDADMAVFAFMTEASLDKAFDVLSSEKYLGSDYLQVLSNEDPLNFVAAPRKALVDLRTMKVLALDVFLGKKYEISELIQLCNDRA